jgi:hypothetical protein
LVGRAPFLQLAFTRHESHEGGQLQHEADEVGILPLVSPAIKNDD